MFNASFDTKCSSFSRKISLQLNFGSGHGGISYLFWLDKFNVINVDPFNRFNYSRYSIEKFSDLSKINKKIDFFYSSHSLEHVSNLEKTLNKIDELLNINGYLFFEVPNAMNPENGGINGKIVPPHTYYFKKSFFEKLKYKMLFCEIYKQDEFIATKSDREDSGEIIRYLGKKIK